MGRWGGVSSRRSPGSQVLLSNRDRLKPNSNPDSLAYLVLSSKYRAALERLTVARAHLTTVRFVVRIPSNKPSLG